MQLLLALLTAAAAAGLSSTPRGPRPARLAVRGGEADGEALAVAYTAGLRAAEGAVPALHANSLDPANAAGPSWAKVVGRVERDQKQESG